MRAMFEGKLTGQETILIPEQIARELPSDSPIRVILLWDGEDTAWKALSGERFGKAYAAGDDVYESLLNEPAAR